MRLRSAPEAARSGIGSSPSFPMALGRKRFELSPCAVAIRDDSAARGIALRAGIHTGEVDIVGDDINGISVLIADRITALAQQGQILTSRTVKDLLTGSGIAFAEVGAYELAESGDWWPVYAVTGA
jgi:class 3 adenylate cyclase